MRLASVIAASTLLLAACAPQTGAGSAGPSSSGGIEITVSHTSAGDALAGTGGMTLYIFAADTSGTSTCTGDCAAAWPPFLGDGSEVTAGEGVSGEFGTTTRDDGSKQVTHNGQPLYYFADDQAAGDAEGQGVGGVWFIAPVGEASASHDGSSAEKPSATPYRAPGYY
jgi:predicted lipoprotein with Yx(FWY)xxD motif